MAKVFNVTAACIPEKHYMVKLDQRLKEIKTLVDDGKYFMINRARQFGKTTTLLALEKYLQDDYYVISIDFQTISTSKFENEKTFAKIFVKEFLDEIKRNVSSQLRDDEGLKVFMQDKNHEFELPELFEVMKQLVKKMDIPKQKHGRKKAFATR